MLEKFSKLKIETRAYIDGVFVNTEKKIVKNSSYTGDPIPQIAACSEKEIDKVVKCAKRTFEMGIWSELNPAERKNILLKLADLMEEHRDELAMLDTLETSRAYKNYYYDSIPKAIEALRYFAEAIDKIYERAIGPRANAFCTITRVPLGVVGIITPWNDPLVVSTWKFAPALLMGNSIVIKPAEQSSLSILKVAELTKQAGIPDGVFNVVPGYGTEAGKALALHNDVDGIFFTGSSDVGKLMLEYSAKSNMKKVGLECGGKSPYIVSANSDRIKEAAVVLAKNMFYNQGQICSAPSRVIVDKKVKSEFLEMLKKEAEKYCPSNPYDINNEVGCLVSSEQYDRINDFLKKVPDTAKIYSPNIKTNLLPQSCAIFPTIISGINPNSELAQNEIFGPVVVILEVDGIKNAIEIANNTKYGLAGAIWTDNLDEAYYAARKVHCGLFHVNSYGEDDNSAPFGGVKQSGLGKDKSVYAFDEYSDLKTIWYKAEDII